MASLQAEKLDGLLRKAPKAVDMPLAEQRAAGEQAESLSSEPSAVTTIDAPAVGGYWSVARQDTGRVMLYLFGGGYVISSPLTRRKLAGHLAEAISGRVLVPNYRLAPEHPFPAAVTDATAAYRWLLDQHIPAAQIVLAGDSSGGGLCVATLVAIRDAGLPLPAGATPISPWVDLACSGASLDSNAQADLTVTKSSLLRMAAQYLHGADPETPLASPVYADLGEIPPLLITVGGAEALLDDSLRLAGAAGMAGTDVTLRIVAGMQHIFPIYFGYLPEADEAVRVIGEWVKRRVAPLTTRPTA